MNLDLQKESQVCAGLYEREIYPVIRRMSQGIRTMVDLGAAHGQFTLYALLKTTADRVISFEPDSEMIGNLRGNLKLNGLEQNQRLEFHDKFVGHADGPDHISVDRLADWIQAPCFIKMDIEGAEVDVLRASVPRLLAMPGLRWLIETHSDEIREQCESILARAGYSATYIPQAWWRVFVPELRGMQVGWLAASKR